MVVLTPELARRLPFVRKQAGQLASKMRYLGAQFAALLADDLWLRSARHANAMAALLAEVRRRRRARGPGYAPGQRSVRVVAVTSGGGELQAWSFVSESDADHHEVRAMTSFATTPDDVDRFVAVSPRWSVRTPEASRREAGRSGRPASGVRSAQAWTGGTRAGQ